MRLSALTAFMLIIPLNYAALGKFDKAGKVISVFNIVQFQNDPCVTQTTGSGSSGNLMGSCLTTTECQDKGGAQSGSCAAGFGACCLFTTSTCGSSFNQNCTYVRNPGFPSALTGTTACTFNINRCSNDICQFKLDFLSFTLAGIDDATTEANGGHCIDTFMVTNLPGSRTVPTICGVNTGQHMFVDVGQSGGSATLSFAFSGSTTRNWEIKVTQISCYDRNRAPDGCLQYVTGCNGMIMTFNFNDNTGNHLANQCYTHCIRQEEGMCCIKYTQCASDQFELDSTNSTAAMVDTTCSNDFIIIEGSSSNCCLTCGALRNRYCGKVLNSNPYANLAFGAPTNPTEICDCTPPFEVGIVTNNGQDMAGTAAVGVGVCLKWKQTPCGVPS